MKIICVCGKEFDVGNQGFVLPNHSKPDGDFCTGSFVMGNRNIINLAGILQFGNVKDKETAIRIINELGI
jgi:hypothetical protein